MRYFLGVDGGGTGCRAMLVDAGGRLLGQGLAGPANIMSDAQAATEAIMEASLQALQGRPPAEVSACLGIAGARISGAVGWLGPRLPFGRCRVLGDGEIAVAGALGARDGIVVALGTGSLFTRQLAGAFASIGGWGPVLGDEGGGAWMGRQLLARVLRAQDGLEPETPLVRRVLQRMGGAQMVVSFARSASGADFAAQVPEILHAGDDPLAQAILAEAQAHVEAGIARLQTDPALPVIFAGRLGSLLAPRVTRWSRAEPLGSALDGALRLARAP
jgi:glucosamine kinase